MTRPVRFPAYLWVSGISLNWARFGRGERDELVWRLEGSTPSGSTTMRHPLSRHILTRRSALPTERGVNPPRSKMVQEGGRCRHLKTSTATTRIHLRLEPPVELMAAISSSTSTVCVARNAAELPVVGPSHRPITVVRGLAASGAARAMVRDGGSDPTVFGANALMIQAEQVDAGEGGLLLHFGITDS